MQLATIIRILGVLLMLFSFTMLAPFAVSLWYGDSAMTAFGAAYLLILISGFILWLPFRGHRRELRVRDGFLIVVLFWTVLGASGAVPLMLADNPGMSLTDAMFESISGLTTTGATVITGIDSLPKSILFYRQQLQWMGGMGIIVLAVAILPMLGIGGMQLYRAETPGPMKDSKLTARISETAKTLWYIYVWLTVACALAYWLAGMDLFDAICHSFSTIAIGGFSTHDASMGYFDSALIDYIAIFFMVVAGVNFSLHFVTFRSVSLGHYWRDPELKTYLMILGATSALVIGALSFTNVYDGEMDTFRHALFQTVSMATTTGFATQNFSAWPIYLPALLIFVSFVGGCAGSTGGGMKVIRILLLFKQGMREIRRLIHPNGVFLIKIGGSPLPDRILEAVWGFFAAYVLLFAIMMVMLMATGLDQVTSFSAVAAALNNLGPGLGSVAAHYGEINDFSKWILSFAMLMGRLEIFTLLVLFTPTFWKS